MASLPPCLPNSLCPSAVLSCAVGTGALTSYLCPNPSSCPADTTLASGTPLQTRGCRWEQGWPPWAMETRISPEGTAGMTSCSMCSAGVTVATSPWPVYGQSCMAAHSSQETSLLPQSDVQGELGSGTSRCEQMAPPASPITSQGMHQLGAPQHSPACPAPSQHGSLLAAMERWAKEQEAAAGLC